MRDESRSSSSALPQQSLEHELGKPRSEWSIDDLVGIYSSRGVEIVSLMHVGGDGWLKTLDFVPQSVTHLRDIVQGGERADGSSLFPRTGIKPNASDIVLRPRVGSAFLDPFAALPTLVLMCGHVGRDGTPLPQSPDTILRCAADMVLEHSGCELWALGEVEYFLGKRRDESDIYGADDRGYHASSPFVFGEALRRRALAVLADIGVRVKYGHSEVGYIEAREANGVIWEQHEIELSLRPLPEAAEATLLTQWVLRNLAHASGMRCSTEPMMSEGHAGNGLHFHLAPMEAGKPIDIRDEGGKLTDQARWLIGGLVQLGGALMAFGNRVEGSFARLAQAKEAPNSIVWGEFDRSALVRLPAVPTDENGRPVVPRTIEFRLPDGSALPHLLLAGAALSMIHGCDTTDLDELLERTSSIRAAQQGERIERVPRNFMEVADAVERYRDVLQLGGAFPGVLIDQVVASLRG
jgi:glutamine synthetase